MKSFELLLTVLFVLIIYLIIIKDMDSSLIMGMSSIWFVILYIGWDNMGAWDGSDKTEKMIKKLTKMSMKAKNKFRKMIESDSDSDSDDKISKKIEKRMKKKMKEKKVRFEFDSESESESDSDAESKSESESNLRVIFKAKPSETCKTKTNPKYNYDIIDDLGSNGDNLLSKRMKHMSNKNRESVDNYARQNKMTNMSYFEDELKDHANSVWWDDETLENEF